MGPVKSAINIPEERLTTLRGAFLRFQATVDVEADYAWVLMTFFPAERTYVRRCHWYAGIKERSEEHTSALPIYTPNTQSYFNMLIQ